MTTFLFKKSNYFLWGILCLQLWPIQLLGAEYLPGPNARFSVLTCTPGPDLYSLFGHSAIRFTDSTEEGTIDWVYNYGTFEFDDDFYLKFARGKLDYLLSKEDFSYFQEEYIYTGRAIVEQELLFSIEEKIKLFQLLEENYLPANRTYRYDFFYDNCSTRIRDIVAMAASHEVDFKYQYSKQITFRQAIQSYLNYQPWSDLGIDIALGLPCDRKMLEGQAMFLPDSLRNEFKYAHNGAQPLILKEEEILPAEYVLSLDGAFTPLFVFSFFLVVHIFLGWILLRKFKQIQITDRIIFFISGIIGVFVLLLWLATDHNATAWNLNLLWANPVNLLMCFLPVKAFNGWKKLYLGFYLFVLLLTLLAWFILPQQLNLSLIPLILALVFSSLKILRPNLFLGNAALRMYKPISNEVE